MEKMNKTREEVIAFSLEFAQTIAKCKEITLKEERIDGDMAELLFEQIDICGNESDAQEQQKVRMINEDGWKIDDLEIIF